MGVTQLVLAVTSRFGLEFTRPHYLVYLWLILPLWLLSLLIWWRTMRSRFIMALGLRTFAFILLVLAISGLSVKRQELRWPTVIASVDVSDSMGEEGRSWARERAEDVLVGSGEETEKGVVSFASGSEMKLPVARKLVNESFDYNIPTDATDISSAVKAALLALPAEGPKRLLIFSDGNETEGDALAAAKEAAQHSVRIDCFSPSERRVAKAVLKKLDLPEQVNVSGEFIIRIIAGNYGSKALRASLTIRDGEKVIKNWDVTLQPGTNAFEIPYSIVSPGTHRIKSSLGVGAEEKELSVPLIVVDRPRVLCLSGTSAGKSFLDEVLTARDIDVEVGGPELMPKDMQGLLSYDCVILSNVPRTSLSDSEMDMLERYVEDYGGGLIMLGGVGSFGPGGYRDTPIEKALPVSMEGSEPFAKDKVVRLSLILVIDRSGSMVESTGFGFVTRGNKMRAAKRAAEELVKQLKPNDRLGIIPFDYNYQVIVPLGPIGDRQPYIIDRIRSVRAGGDTIISKPLEEALRQMLDSDGKVKHVILLTDGQTKDVKSYNYKRLVTAYAKSGVSLSTVGIGRDADEHFLRAVASGTGGDYYHVKDTSVLPLIVLNDTKKVLQESGFLEDAVSPKVGEKSQMLKGIQQEQIPKLLGYVITKPKKGSEIVLYTNVRGFKDPLLAAWRYGLGKTVAFMSDAEARWSREMVSWRMFSKFWTQILRWTMRGRSEDQYVVRYRLKGDRRYLELRTFGQAGGEISFRVEFPDRGKKRRLVLNQVAPTVYEREARELSPLIDSVVVEKVESGKVVDRKEVALVRQGKASMPSAETDIIGNNEELLGKIAVTTGGMLNPKSDELEFNKVSVVITGSMVGWLLPFIFALFLADIALRKFGV